MHSWTVFLVLTDADLNAFYFRIAPVAIRVVIEFA